MASTNIGAIVRQQAWFRPSVGAERIPPFPVAKIDVIPLQPTGMHRARVLLGRGPVDHELTPDFLPWFEHGEQDYPTFQCPSIGPSGAGLKLSSRPRRMIAGPDDALGMIEISLLQPVPQSFRDDYQGSPAGGADAPAVAVRRWLSESRTLLEQAIGLYALYQYPIVWEPLGVHPMVGFVDFQAQTFQLATRFEADNFVPFRLNVDAKLENGDLVDDCLSSLPGLENLGLHFPLLLLQRALWQRNVQLRFLETFMLLDYLTGRSGVEDPGRSQRETLFGVIEAVIVRDHPEHKDRVAALKQIVLQAPLRERLEMYLQRLGISPDPQILRQMLRARNDLAHGRPVSEEDLRSVELNARTLARDVMRRELESNGIQIGNRPTVA